jgi:deazaflavin-dependent oxidoreductase (nitroreductase family)
MGLLKDMELAPIEANALQRALQSIGATSIGTAVFSAVLGPLDRLAHRLSAGRSTAGRVFGALPVVMLTSIGARSGEKRVHPLSAIPYKGEVALLATNYGKGRVPAWAHNLRANPDATLNYRGRDFEVVAAEVDLAEHDTVFAAAIGVYAGYARYRKTATNDIPIFFLRAKGSE